MISSERIVCRRVIPLLFFGDAAVPLKSEAERERERERRVARPVQGRIGYSTASNIERRFSPSSYRVFQRTNCPIVCLVRGNYRFYAASLCQRRSPRRRSDSDREQLRKRPTTDRRFNFHARTTRRSRISLWPSLREKVGS